MTEKANSKTETSKAYAAFMRYCGLGPGRSLAKLAEILNKPSGYTRQLALWSSDFNWVERAKEYDVQQLDKKAQEDYERQRKEEEERIAALKEMRERQARTARELQEKIIKHLEVQIASGDIGSLPAVNLLKLVYDTEQKVLDGVEKIEVSGKDGGPIVIRTQWGTPKVERSKGEE